ncbi:RagB/SusD family nutrient uptake outer membrane protein [Chitinophaga sp. Cy-1792]|uniref:RagB/SusD family nutrient uptake outer membrane protein n=1 Tax=Chitinophaga sp. Cy-1792 TaxID=2608339 RepID=UPI00141E2198|nr:RagB/SusD family nutrient uptake outer membrane protein [Chitinophaga sp. Cy-1792]
MKKISVYTLALGAAIMMASCQKSLLNPKPQSDLDAGLVFDTPDRIASQNNGLYTMLKNGKFLGGKFQIANEVRGEDFSNELSNSVTLALSWRRNVGNETQEVKEIWAQGYLSINNANLFIDGMNAQGNKVVGDSLGKIYVGEAKFVRAISYFSLLQLYARPFWDGAGGKPGLILYLEGHKEKGNYAKARSTVAEIYTQILKDLDEAEAVLPKSTAGTVKAITHANYYSVVALKTRVYLYMGKYDKVITEAQKIVTGTTTFSSPGGHSLNTEIAKVFAPPYTTTESMFSLPFTGTTGDFPGTQTQLGYYFAPSSLPYAGNGEYSLISTGVISDSSWKTATDARRKFLFAVGSKYFLVKYPTPNPYTDWAPVIRYSEILLNYAEALVKQNNTVDPTALALLNAVRHRADPTVTFTAAGFATPTALVNAIWNEKHIELLGEGFRGMEVTRTQQNFVARGGVVQTLTTDTKYIWPISSDELVYNKLCVDNQ